jgi:hypothetical protein
MSTPESQPRKEPKAPAYELSDAEKRGLIALIQAGKPLLEKYRNDIIALVPVHVS